MCLHTFPMFKDMHTLFTLVFVEKFLADFILNMVVQFLFWWKPSRTLWTEKIFAFFKMKFTCFWIVKCSLVAYWTYHFIPLLYLSVFTLLGMNSKWFKLFWCKTFAANTIYIITKFTMVVVLINIWKILTANWALEF